MRPPVKALTQFGSILGMIGARLSNKSNRAFCRSLGAPSTLSNAQVRLASDTVSREELEAAAKWMLESNQLTKGPQTIEFEKEFAAYMGSRFAVFVNSGSSANLLMAAALKASGKLRNMKVVCPAVAWVTTVTPFTQLGFDVTLWDSNASNLGIETAGLEDLFIKERPAILVLVHVLGHPNSMTEIVALCEQYDVVLLEDSCEALGTSVIDDVKLGTIGLAGSFSFYYGHHISTIEGGMVVTDDFDLHQLMLSLRSHGWSRDLDNRVKQELQKQHDVDDFRNLYTFYHHGFNFRSTDLQAFIGRGQLRKIHEIVATRSANHALYSELLTGFWTQKSDAQLLSSFAYGTAVLNRSEVALALSKGGG